MCPNSQELNLSYSRLRMFASVRNMLLLCCSYICIFSRMTMQRPIWFFAFCLFGPTVQCTMLCRVHIVACRLIYLIYLMNFSNRIEIWPSAGYLFCFLPDIYLCHQSKHLHFTTMTIYLFLFEGVQFDTVEIYIKTWLNIESIVNTVKA